MCTCMIDMADGTISMGIIMMRAGSPMTLLRASHIPRKEGDRRTARVLINTKGSSADHETNPANPPLKGKRTL